MAVNRLCLRSPITEPRRKAAEAKRTSTVLHGYHHALYGLGRSRLAPAKNQQGSKTRQVNRNVQHGADRN
jgi:hypothetical protein